jgi:hypothetical protein
VARVGSGSAQISSGALGARPNSCGSLAWCFIQHTIRIQHILVGFKRTELCLVVDAISEKIGEAAFDLWYRFFAISLLNARHLLQMTHEFLLASCR